MQNEEALLNPARWHLANRVQHGICPSERAARWSWNMTWWKCILKRRNLEKIAPGAISASELKCLAISSMTRAYGLVKYTKIVQLRWRGFVSKSATGFEWMYNSLNKADAYYALKSHWLQVGCSVWIVTPAGNQSTVVLELCPTGLNNLMIWHVP